MRTQRRCAPTLMRDPAVLWRSDEASVDGTKELKDLGVSRVPRDRALFRFAPPSRRSGVSSAPRDDRTDAWADLRPACGRRA